MRHDEFRSLPNMSHLPVLLELGAHLSTSAQITGKDIIEMNTLLLEVLSSQISLYFAFCVDGLSEDALMNLGMRILAGSLTVSIHP